MQRFKIQIAVFFMALGALLGVAVFDATTGRGQSKPQSKPGAEAAKLNAQLISNLSWTFGSKPQRGWYLYESLTIKPLKIAPDCS